MKSVLKIAGMFVLAGSLITSCKKEENPVEENDNELITTVEVRVAETGSANAEIFKWEDLDGDGGNAPVIEDITLQPGKTYSVQLGLLDASKNPVESITTEIVEESDVHRFYFEPSAGLGVTVSNLDMDAADIPLGLNSTWTTTAASSGSIKIVLRHYPNGGKEVSDPVSSTKSSTDAEVVFNVTVAAP